jgi:hypothetical protein
LRIAGKSDLVKAFRYNNLVERALRPIGIGRKIGYSLRQKPVLKLSLVQ